MCVSGERGRDSGAAQPPRQGEVSAHGGEQETLLGAGAQCGDINTAPVG